MDKLKSILNNFLILTLCFFLLFSCKSENPKEGEYELAVKGGKLWYKVIGSGTKTPIVMLHGGPGFPSYYLTPLFELANDRQIIVYDQLSSGRSSNSDDTSLMNLETQLEHLQALLQELHIKDYYLYGHSYGSMLAVSHYLRGEYKPGALILESPFFDARTWVADSYKRVNAMDSIDRVPILNFIAGKYTDTANYAKALNKYYSLYYNRKMNRYLDSSIVHSGKLLGLQMNGANEFLVGGNLKDINLIGELKNIKVPVLYTTGEFDIAMPETVKKFQSLTPNAKFVVINNAGHSVMNDNTAADLKAIRTFINSLETKTSK